MLFTSQTIAAASGSAGGLTASRNRFGMYFRTRAVPVNPNTSFQQTVRGLLAEYATRWGTLTQTVRDAWGVYATNTPVVNKLGASVTLTGMNMYVRSNTARAQAGLSVVDAAPTTYGLPTFTDAIFGAAVPAGVPTLSIGYTASDAWAQETGGALIIAASRPYGASIGFFKGPFRFTAAVLGDDTTPPTSPETDTTPPFPFAVDNKVAIQVRACLADGRLSSPRIYQAVVQ